MLCLVKFSLSAFMKPILEQSLIFVGAVILSLIAQNLRLAPLINPGRGPGWMGLGTASIRLRPLPYSSAGPALLGHSFAAADFLEAMARRIRHRKPVLIHAMPEHAGTQAGLRLKAEVLASLAVLEGEGPVLEHAGP
jgi:hypothetical protein